MKYPVGLCKFSMFLVIEKVICMLKALHTLKKDSDSNLLLFSHSVVSNTATTWTAAHQASLSFTISWSFLKLRTIESMMPSDHRTLHRPLFLLSSVFPSMRVFSYKSAFHNRWPKYWSFSFSISPYNEYSGLISFRLSGLISLLSKGLSRVFSSTTVQKH